jgi:hypothetical protein
MGIGRFLVGSALLFAGWMVVLSAAVTVVGLPIGVMVVAAALELLFGPSSRRGRRPGPPRGIQAPEGRGT